MAEQSWTEHVKPRSVLVLSGNSSSRLYNSVKTTTEISLSSDIVHYLESYLHIIYSQSTIATVFNQADLREREK